MSVHSPNPEERKRLLQAFHELPRKEKEILYSAVEHLGWLTMLWELEQPNPESMPSTSEKRHILLAYKLLQIVWFSKLPEKDHSAFTVYVRDRLPEDQDPQTVNDTFATHSDELAARCESLSRPQWLAKETKAIKTSLNTFPLPVS